MNSVLSPRRRGPKVVALLAILVFPTGCRGTIPTDEIDATLAGAMGAARSLEREGSYAEAAELTRQVMIVDPDYQGARELLAALPAEYAEPLYSHPMLGSNVAKRFPTERSMPARVLLYLPDRILDLLDVVSFDVHAGPGLFANVHLTRGFQLGAGARGVSGLGWHDHRSLGLLAQFEAGVAVPAVESMAFAGGSIGSSGLDVVNETATGLARPSDTIYQRLRDYWAVGAAVTLLLVGADVDLHPVELFDFFVGFGPFDPLRDDFATTRGLDMPRNARMRLWELARITMSEDSMVAYRAR